MSKGKQPRIRRRQVSTRESGYDEVLGAFVDEVRKGPSGVIYKDTSHWEAGKGKWMKTTYKISDGRSEIVYQGPDYKKERQKEEASKAIVAKYKEGVYKDTTKSTKLVKNNHVASCTCKDCRPDKYDSAGKWIYESTYINDYTKPWEAFDRKKWPNTWAWYLCFYYQSDYHQSTVSSWAANYQKNFNNNKGKEETHYGH